MTNKVDYKKIRTDIINGKKRCIYMKPKGKREYVKSGGEFVSLSAYIKTLQKKNKKKGGGDGEGDEVPARVATTTNPPTALFPASVYRPSDPYEGYKDINEMALKYANENKPQSSGQAVSTKRPLPPGWVTKSESKKGV
jgi:hypothetical protein